MKLNLGCGNDIRDDYENYDLFPVNDRVKKLDLNKLPLPFKNNSVNKILIHSVFHHLDINKIQLMKELSRILKKNGQLVISVPIYHNGLSSGMVYYPRRFFSGLAVGSKRNAGYVYKMFKSVSVETYSNHIITKILVINGFFERLFQHILSGKRIFKLIK
jgi:SAM-dependent methyltransferase